MPKSKFTNLKPLPSDPDTLITRSDLPTYIPIAVSTWAKWAVTGAGPKFLKLGSKVAYRVRDIQSWLDEQGRTNTVQASLDEQQGAQGS
jgi:hypothetical protein